MSSTNVHSNPYIVGGDTNFTENEKQPVNMQQYNEKGEPSAGEGPSRLEVIEGPNTEIVASDNIVARDDEKNNEVKARAICKDGTNIKNMEISDITVVMVGQIAAFKQAIDKRKAKTSKNKENDKEGR